MYAEQANGFTLDKLNSVKIIQKYIQKKKKKKKKMKGRSEYMFQGAVYRLQGINKPVTYSNVRQGVLNVLKKLRLSSEDYSLHSMRADGCTMAKKFGVKERVIKTLGRWKSDRVKTGILTPP